MDRMYPMIQFSPEEIELFKEMTLRKNEESGYNNLSKNYRTRYVGKPGEKAVERYLGPPAKIKDGDQPWDISFPPVLLEVKTLATRRIPLPSFACDFNQDQLRRSKADIYVFCRFQEDIRTVYLCGWIEAGDFHASATFRDRGDVIIRSDGSEFPVEAPFYEVPISLLEPMSTLRRG